MSRVITFDYGEPRQRLLAWFLSDSGIANERVTTLGDVLRLLRGESPAVVIVNSTSPIAEIAGITRELRAAVPQPRVIVVHEDAHGEAGRTIDADVCIHDVQKVDELVKVVTAALLDDLPDGEPHAVAEEVIEEDTRA